MANKTAKLCLVFVLVCLGAVLAYLMNERSPEGIDDANIYFIYMRNLADGYGFVYRAGGERVEGFTSLLWCLVGALCFAFTTRPEIWLLCINIGAVTFALWRLLCFSGDYFGDRRVADPSTLFILGALLLVPGYFEWTVLALMETGIWSALLTGCFLNLCRAEMQPARLRRYNVRLSVLLVLLVAARPESLVWGAVILAVRLYQVYRNRPRPERLKTALAPVLSFVLPVTALLCWRLYYFGYPFPNTYYAKVSQDMGYNLGRGLAYLRDAARFTNPLLFAAAAVPPLYLLLRRRKPEGIGYISVWFVLVTAALPLYAGGDHFALARLLVPSLPVVYFSLCVFASGVGSAYFRPVKRPYLWTVLLLAATVLIPARDGWISSLQRGYGALRMEFVIAKYDRLFGERMNAFFDARPVYPSQGVLSAGGNPYRYRGVSVDLLGLNNVQMAHADRVKTRDLLKGHASFNKDVFYLQKPDLFWLSVIRFMPLADTAAFVLPESGPDYRYDLAYTVYKGIMYDSLFRATYYPVHIIKEGDPECLFTYAHRDFLPTLRPPYTYRLIPRGG